MTKSDEINASFHLFSSLLKGETRLWPGRFKKGRNGFCRKSANHEKQLKTAGIQTREN
jgi:hypothetical protein